MDGVEAQREAADSIYAPETESTDRWAFHYTKDPLIRYLRDRRLHTALEMLRGCGKLAPERQRVLISCGGVGGEGTFLANHGFGDVTVSDLSEEALDRCGKYDSRLKTLHLNAEAMDLPDCSYDLVLVQDGLHHLPRPALGLTEMLRVCRDAVVVIEPHFGLAGRVLGTRWERHGDAVNFVFRWSRQSFEQVVRSYLLTEESEVLVRRLWDHNSKINAVVRGLPNPLRLPVAKGIYGALRPLSAAGNMFVGVATKPSTPPPPRLAAH